MAYPVRFFSTLPDTAANALRVNLGAVPQQKVIADKAFNRASYTNAVLGCAASPAVILPRRPLPRTAAAPGVASSSAEETNA